MKYLDTVMLLLFIVGIGGCAAIGEKAMQRAEEQQRYVQNIWSTADSTSPEVLRRAELKKVIPKPLPAVYRAATIVLSEQTRGWGAHLPSKAGESASFRKIIYDDTEPILNKRKAVKSSDDSSSGFFGKPWRDPLHILVTVFMESQGPQSTAVYYYPHNRLCSKIPPEAQGIVEANLMYRGELFIYRLETQALSQEKWGWLGR
jgi:hypothetical protein